MVNLLETWQHLTASEQVFCFVGLVSNALFILYVFLSQFLDSDHGIEHAGFSGDLDTPILSIRSILAFGMFAGWTGFALERSGWSTPMALAGAVAAGFFAAWLAYRMLLWMLTWQSSGTLNLEKAVGQTGTVYVPIPVQGDGKGKIHLELQGALREMDAVSANGPLTTGSYVLVLEYDPEQQAFVVEKTL